jgi:hypothetical protein
MRQDIGREGPLIPANPQPPLSRLSSRAPVLGNYGLMSVLPALELIKNLLPAYAPCSALLIGRAAIKIVFQHDGDLLRHSAS